MSDATPFHRGDIVEYVKTGHEYAPNIGNVGIVVRQVGESVYVCWLMPHHQDNAWIKQGERVEWSASNCRKIGEIKL